MALLALGDTQTPVVAFEYLEQVQVGPKTPGNAGATGWFLQKTHVDGTLEWLRVQMDQSAMPVMLGWRLWQAGLLSDAEIADWYRRMLKPAAEFLANGGDVSIGGDGYRVEPPWTRLERWEEQAGYSPSTTAAVIAGLVVAADIARHAADPGAAAWYEQQADLFAANVERRMVTTTAPTGGAADGRHYLRIATDLDPNDGDAIEAANGQPALDERSDARPRLSRAGALRRAPGERSVHPRQPAGDRRRRADRAAAGALSAAVRGRDGLRLAALRQRRLRRAHRHRRRLCRRPRRPAGAHLAVPYRRARALRARAPEGGGRAARSTRPRSISSGTPTSGPWNASPTTA